jgi:hypothetical protein
VEVIEVRHGGTPPIVPTNGRLSQDKAFCPGVQGWPGKHSKILISKTNMYLTRNQENWMEKDYISRFNTIGNDLIHYFIMGFTCL